MQYILSDDDAGLAYGADAIPANFPLWKPLGPEALAEADARPFGRGLRRGW